MDPDPFAREQVAVAEDAVAETAAGWMTKAFAIRVHPLASVTVTV